MNSAELLYEKSFWLYYLGDEDYEIDASVVEKYGCGDQHGESYVQFVLPCPKPFAIHISVGLTVRAIDATLAYGDKKNSELGWWDEARSHPFFLRWEEFDKLVRYWETCHSQDTSTVLVSKLLLSRFTGNPTDDQRAIAPRRKQIALAYESLKLFSQQEIQKLVEKTVIMAFEEDYAWTIDKELGWVFGGEYPCYSLRNAEHADGKEGRFPFQAFREMIDSLEK